jgi:rare lipoprotein A
LAELASQPDPVPQVEPIRPGGPNKPYVVLGQAYAPMAEDVPWSERGAASWYGQKFHGRRTASGEVYSMYGLTAAHRTLPIPSYARVRNVRNGKEVIVRVNDRGPFHAQRVMDLSYAAAVKLDIAATGTGEVEISRLTFDDIRAAAAAPALNDDPLGELATRVANRQLEPMSAVGRAYTPASKGFWVQLASLSRHDGVARLQQRIGEQLDGLTPLLTVFHEPPLFKLQVGPYASREEAQQAAQQARRALKLDPMVVERR